MLCTNGDTLVTASVWTYTYFNYYTTTTVVLTVLYCCTALEICWWRLATRDERAIHPCVGVVGWLLLCWQDDTCGAQQQQQQQFFMVCSLQQVIFFLTYDIGLSVSGTAQQHHYYHSSAEINPGLLCVSRQRKEHTHTVKCLFVCRRYCCCCCFYPWALWFCCFMSAGVGCAAMLCWLEPTAAAAAP